MIPFPRAFRIGFSAFLTVFLLLCYNIPGFTKPLCTACHHTVRGNRSQNKGFPAPIWAREALFGLFYLFVGGYQMKKIGIVMGSDSDLPVLRKAMDTLRVPYLFRPPHSRGSKGICPVRPGKRLRRHHRRRRHGCTSGRRHCSRYHHTGYRDSLSGSLHGRH